MDEDWQCRSTSCSFLFSVVDLVLCLSNWEINDIFVIWPILDWYCYKIICTKYKDTMVVKLKHDSESVLGVRCHIFSISSKIYMPRSSSRHRNGIKFYSMSSNVTLKYVSFSIYVHVVCPVSKQTCSSILDLIKPNSSFISNHKN